VKSSRPLSTTVMLRKVARACRGSNAREPPVAAEPEKIDGTR
jgi:hypothetical protein